MIWRENKYSEAKISSQSDLDSKNYWGKKITKSFRESEIMFKTKQNKKSVL